MNQITNEDHLSYEIAYVVYSVDALEKIFMATRARFAELSFTADEIEVHYNGHDVDYASEILHEVEAMSDYSIDVSMSFDHRRKEDQYDGPFTRHFDVWLKQYWPECDTDTAYDMYQAWQAGIDHTNNKI